MGSFFFFFLAYSYDLIIIPHLQKSVIFLRCLGEEKKVENSGLESVCSNIEKN